MNISFPAPADEGAADRLTESFAALGVAYRAFAEGHGLALLRCLGGNAPYLADLALAEPDYVLAVMEAGPGPVLPAILALLREFSPAESRAKTARALRLAAGQTARGPGDRDCRYWRHGATALDHRRALATGGGGVWRGRAASAARAA